MMSRMLPPGPRGMPILGMLPAVRRDPTGVFMRAARRFGDVVYFKIGPRRGYLLTNPSRYPPCPAGQRPQLSQEPALSEAADVDRQRPADQRRRVLAAAAPHRAAGLPSAARRRARRCDGQGRARDSGRVAVDGLRRTSRGHLRGDDALHAHRGAARAARRRSRSIRLEDRSGVGGHQRARREQLLVAGHRRAVSTREGAAVRRGAVRPQAGR